jgi:hypothetical protein
LAEIALTPTTPFTVGLGIATCDQAVPFQCKTTDVDGVVWVRPTAQASRAEEALTSTNCSLTLEVVPVSARAGVAQAEAKAEASTAAHPAAATAASRQVTR